MKSVRRSRLQRIVEMYDEPFRYLQSMETAYPKAQGVFQVSPSAYTTTPIPHFATPQAIICIFQFNYVAFAEWLREGRFPELDLSLDEYVEHMPSHMFLTRSQTDVRFRREISTQTPIIMNGELKRLRRVKDLWVVGMEYEINQGMATASNTLALKLPTND